MKNKLLALGFAAIIAAGMWLPGVSQAQVATSNNFGITPGMSDTQIIQILVQVVQQLMTQIQAIIAERSQIVSSTPVVPIITTSTQSSITILSPSGGEQYDFATGMTISVAWTMNYNSPSLTVYMYNPNVGNVYVSPATTGSVGKNGWTIPAAVVNAIPSTGGQYKVGVCDNNQSPAGLPGKALCSWSDYFTATGNGSISNTPATPAAPTAVATGQTSVSLSWPAVSGATSYHISRVPPNLDINTVYTNSYADANAGYYGMTCGTTYQYRIEACNSSDGGYTGCSAWGPWTSVTTDVCSVTSTPSTTPVVTGVSGPQSLNVGQTGTWTVNAYDPQGGNLSYSVLWGDSGAGPVYPTTQSIQQTATFTHAYNTGGTTYMPIFTVTNTSGKTAQTSLTVKVGAASTTSLLNLLSPARGETLTAGTTYVIRWSATQDLLARYPYVDIILGGYTSNGCSVFGCGTLPPERLFARIWDGVKSLFGITANAQTSAIGTKLAIATNVSLSSGSYTWSIPSDITNKVGSINGNYQIYFAQSQTNNYVYPYTDNTFRIISTVSTQPSVVVTMPNGGETYTAGGSISIVWKKSGVSIQNDNNTFLYAVDSKGYQTTVASNLADNQTSYTWSTSGVAPGSYKIRLNVVYNGAVLEDYSDGYFTISGVATTTPALSAPTLVSPSNGTTVNSTSPTLQWSSSGVSTAAPTYWSQALQVATDPGFSNLIVNKSAIDGASRQYSLSNLSGGTTYYWRVEVSNINGESPWSSAWSFTTPSAVSTAPATPAAPTVTVTGPTSISVSWQSVAGATSYHISRTPPNLDINTVNSTAFADSGSYNMACGTGYQYQIEACNSYGCSAWSSPSFATTSACAAGYSGSSLNASLLDAMQGTLNSITSALQNLSH